AAARSVRGAARQGTDEPARGRAGGRLRQLRPVPPGVSRPPPHDPARVPPQPRLTTRVKRQGHPTIAPRLSLSTVACLAAGCIVHDSGVRATAGGGAVAASSAAGGIAPPGYNRTGSPALPAPPGGGATRPSGPAGNLTVLDWAGFRAAVTYTFDDANSSQIQHYSELQALGVRMTFYLITGKRPEFGDPIWARAVRDGHEIGSHSKSHQHGGTAADMDASNQAIRQTLGVDAWTMAAPYGDASYIPLAPDHYLINRGVANGAIGPGDETDPV